MRGIDFIKKRFDEINVQCIETAIVNINLNVLYDSYDSESEFKDELIEHLKDFGYKFSKRVSLKKICEDIMDRDSMEKFEEALARSTTPLSELEEWQSKRDYGNDSDVDIEINPMTEYDGFDIADESEN